MRTGPTPLSMHLGMACENLYGEQEINSALSEMVRGIQKYQSYPDVKNDRKYNVIWQKGSCRLLRKSNVQHNAEHNVVLIPSLINGFEILDLNTDRSFCQWLDDNGIQAFIFDWGDLFDNQNIPESTAQLVECYLVPAFEFLNTVISSKPNVLGYCMGGILSVALAHVREDLLNKLVLLATPWYYKAGKGFLSRRVEFWVPYIMDNIKGKGYLPAEWLNSIFASIDPDMTRSKYINFANMRSGSLQERIFVAVEDWLDNGKNLPCEIASECIQNWFIKNSLAKGQWYVDGSFVQPQEINMPVLVVASTKDQLVEFDSAMSLVEAIPNAKLLKPDCGHIGMIAGNRSVEGVWEPISAWLTEKQ